MNSNHQESDDFSSPKSSELLVPLIPKNSTTRISLLFKELTALAQIAFPIILKGLLMYSRSMISTLFLGRLGNLALAGGSLAVVFANLTGYSVLSGLAMGMEPICGHAFGAERYKLLGISLQRTILFLVFTSFPISILWLNMKWILLFCKQDESIATQAQIYLIYSLPDLFVQAFLHPLKIYLRTQSITLPLTVCAAISILLHILINYFLVVNLDMGIKGVALSGVLTNFNLVASIIIYISISGLYKKIWNSLSMECFKGWKKLLNLAIPSCISVCLEWWWYEIMILLCGLLTNPKETVASMGILIQTTALIYIFPSSLNFGVSTRVGDEVGARKLEKTKLAASVGIFWSVMLGLLALCFAVSVRNKWALMFTQDDEIIALTTLVLPIIGLCELANCPQTTGCGLLRGMARPKAGANINLGCFYIVGMPDDAGIAFLYKIDFKGLWVGLLATQGSCVVTMMVVLWRTDWEFEVERAEGLTGGCVVLDETTQCDEKDQMLIVDNQGDNLC